MHFLLPSISFKINLDDDFYTKRQSKTSVQANPAKTLKISILNHELCTPKGARNANEEREVLLAIFYWSFLRSYSETTEWPKKSF